MLTDNQKQHTLYSWDTTLTLLRTANSCTYTLQSVCIILQFLTKGADEENLFNRLLLVIISFTLLTSMHDAGVTL